MLIRSAKEDIKYVMFDREKIAARIRELGKELTEKYRGETPLMLCVLRGASFFFTDLCREMDLLMDIDFIAASSYFSGTKSSGTVRLDKDSNVDMSGRHVVIVEDIIDSGLALEYLVKLFQTRDPKSITTVTLLDNQRSITAANLHILQPLMERRGECLTVVFHHDTAMTASSPVVPLPTATRRTRERHIGNKPYSPG